MFLKSKILDFETLSRVHVFRIEYVSYRQGPYRIRIYTADDRIVPALLADSGWGAPGATPPRNGRGPIIVYAKNAKCLFFSLASLGRQFKIKY